MSTRPCCSSPTGTGTAGGDDYTPAYVMDDAVSTLRTAEEQAKLAEDFEKLARESPQGKALAAKMLSEVGELTAIVTILPDRTEAIERNQLYEQLKVASEELEGKVREATGELANQNELLRRQALETLGNLAAADPPTVTGARSAKGVVCHSVAVTAPLPSGSTTVKSLVS